MIKFEGIIGTIVYVSNIFCSFLSSFRAISPNYILHFVEKNSIKFSERKAKMTSPVASNSGIIPPLPSKISKLTSQSSIDTDELSQDSSSTQEPHTPGQPEQNESQKAALLSNIAAETNPGMLTFAGVDPAFPIEGGAHPREGDATYDFAKFIQKIT